MWKWRNKQKTSSERRVYPPWRVGQYVTYIQELDKGRWVALAILLLGQQEDGTWVFLVDSKSPEVENRGAVQVNPSPKGNDLGVLPLGAERVRGDSDEPFDMPQVHLSLAMNLLLAGQSQTAVDVYNDEPVEVDLPCEIAQVFHLDGAVGQYELNPRVLLTGVARYGDNISVTSFGLNDPQVPDIAGYEDWVDLSHLARVEHDGFALQYPATWFLRTDDNAEPRDGVVEHTAYTGGITCSAVLGVTIYTGDEAWISEERSVLLERFSEEGLSQLGMVPRSHDAIAPPGDSFISSSDFLHAPVDGTSYSLISRSASGNCLAHVSTTACIAKEHPRKSDTLASMERVFRKIVQSFEFV